jgi:hypothetical protein
MNVNFERFAAWLMAGLMALLLSSCATRPKVDPNIDWNSRVGSYTYDQAIAELGKPDAVAESNEGRVVDWVLKRSPNMSFGFGVGHSVFGPRVGTGVGVGTSVTPPPHGEYLRLVFDPQNKLKAWSRSRS